MTPKTIRSYDELLEVLRARRDELNVPHEAIDATAGIAAGHFSKLISAHPMKFLGRISWVVFEVLGLSLIAVEDSAALERARKNHAWRTRKVAPWCTTVNGCRPSRHGHAKPTGEDKAKDAA